MDTDAIVAAMRSPSGASAAILRAARQGRITLLVNVPLALEYEAICSEAEHRLAAGLSEREVRNIPGCSGGDGGAGENTLSMEAATARSW